MTFTYPAIFTPKKDGPGFHVVFPDLEDALDNAMDALYNWISVELEDENGYFPPQTDPEDMELEEGAFVRNIMTRIKFLPDSD